MEGGSGFGGDAADADVAAAETVDRVADFFTQAPEMVFGTTIMSGLAGTTASRSASQKGVSSALMRRTSFGPLRSAVFR